MNKITINIILLFFCATHNPIFTSQLTPADTGYRMYLLFYNAGDILKESERKSFFKLLLFPKKTDKLKKELDAEFNELDLELKKLATCTDIKNITDQSSPPKSYADITKHKPINYADAVKSKNPRRSPKKRFSIER